MSVLEVDLNKFIPPAYDQVFDDLMNNVRVHTVLAGGRGAAKSTFTHDIALMKIITAGSIVYVRRYKNSLRPSVYQAFINALDKYNMRHEFKLTESKLEILHIPTGRKVFFGGLDDPTKLKSFEAPTLDGFAMVIFEEVQEVEAEEKIQSIVLTFARKGIHTNIVYVNNPPPSPRHWVNEVLNRTTSRKKMFLFTFEDIPPEWGWLSKTFLDEAAEMKEKNPLAYDNVFRGLAVGSVGQIFKNVHTLTPDMEYDDSRLFRGVDYGYTKDPTAYVVWAYDRQKHSIYSVYEVYGHGMKHRDLAPQIIEENPDGWIILSDHDQRAIDELGDLGVRGLIKAKKGKNSVDAGTKWLIDLNAIYIDPVKCPETYREFIEYAYPNVRGNSKDKTYPDMNNHTIDATRYALEDVQLGYI